MLLEMTSTITKISGASRPSGFKVKTSPTLFDTMSNNLYNDKIRAVIRELSCNGWDAHAAAGKKQQPFEIHLPTQFEPFFSITDYGTGLKFVKGGCETCHGTGRLSVRTEWDSDTVHFHSSNAQFCGTDNTGRKWSNNSNPLALAPVVNCPDCLNGRKAASTICDDCDGTGDYDAVKRLYCTYFASDKQDSNDAIGGFGLGSKSPFAYLNNGRTTGGFTVTNHYNGQTFNYDAHVGEQKLPEVVMMGEPVDTPDEPNGVKVAFPVQPGDIWEFENKAASVFEFFEPRPILNKPIDIQTPTYSVKTSLWGMRTEAKTEQGSGLRAIMGNVQYTVGNIDTSRLSDAQRKLVGMPIDLFFEVGELQPAASREALSLVGDTIANILNRLDVVQEKLLEEVKKQIDVCRTAWEARLKIHELTMQTGMGAVVNDAYNRGMLNGKYSFFKLDGSTKEGSTKVTINELDYQHIEVTVFRYSDRRTAKKAKKEPLFESATPAKRTEAFRDLGSNVTVKADYNLKLDVDENVIYVINDLKTKADKYVSFMLQHDAAQKAWNDIAQGGDVTIWKYRKAFVINRLSRSTPMNRAGDEAVALLNHIGNPPVVKASDLKAAFDPLMKAEKDVQVIKRERMNVRILRHYAEYTRHSSSGGGWKKQWKSGDDNTTLNDPTVTKFYVVINGHPSFEPTNLPPRFYRARSFIDFVNKVRGSELFPEIQEGTPIFGIKAGSKLLSDSTFVEFLPFVRTRVKATITPAKEMELSLAVKPFSSNWKFLMEYVAEHPQLLLVDSPFRQFSLDIYKAEHADQEGHSNLVALAQELGIAINNTADYSKAWEKILNKNTYPMLKICSRTSYGSGTIEEKTVLVGYIRYTDEQNKRLVLVNISVADETEIEEEETVNV